MMLKRRRAPFIIASLLCLPFLAFPMLVLIDWDLKTANVSLPNCIEIPLFWGLLLLSVWAFMWLPVLVFVSIFVYRAWFQEGKTRFESVCLGIYSVVILAYTGW